MGHIDSGTFEAFMAFGSASIAFSEVIEAVIRCRPAGDAMYSDAINSDAMGPDAVDLLAELRSAHRRLRDLFADGHDDAVCALAPQVIELASRVADALGKDQGPISI
jgi:hypothetical protein